MIRALSPGLPRVADTYGRTSRMGDREVDSDRFHALDIQATSTAQWVAQHDYRQGLHVPETDVSGGRERPALEELIRRVELGQAGALVVANLSRFSRNTLLGLRDIHRIVEAGGRFVALDGVDTNKAEWELFATIRLAIDSDYLNRSRQGFDAVRARLIAEGIHVTNWGNVGYVSAPDRRYLPHARWAEVITRGFEDRANGASLSHVANLLRDRGVVSGRESGRGDLRRTHQEWSTGSVGQVLRRPVYLGWAYWGRVPAGGPLDFRYINRHAHEPLTDLETWTEANRPRATTVGRTARRDGDFPYILRGLVRCAGCGHMMKPDIGKGDPSYRCRKRHTNGLCAAPAAILARVLERRVDEIVLAALAGGGAEGREPTARLEEARKEVVEAAAELAAYVEHTPARVPGYPEGLQRREEALDAAEQRIADIGGAGQLMNLPSRLSVTDAWPELTSDERHRVLRGALDFALVRRAQGPGLRLSTQERVAIVWAGQAPSGLSRPGFSADVAELPFDWETGHPPTTRNAVRQSPESTSRTAKER